MKQKIVILGHENPDVDSIISGYLLERIYQKLFSGFYDVQFVIPDKVLDEESVEICLKYGVDARKYQMDLPLNSETEYILVDHYEDSRISKMPKKIIDHHPTMRTINTDIINKESLSTALALYHLYSKEYTFTEEEIEKIILASYVDTASLTSTKTTAEGKKDIKYLIKEYQINEEPLYEEGLCLTNLKNIREASMHGLKKYKYGEYWVWSSYVQIKSENHELIPTLLKQCQQTLKNEKLACFVFIEHDMSVFESTAYFITKDGISTKKYDSYTSRGSTIMPVIEEIFMKEKTVFIGSSSRKHQDYQQTARELSNWLQSKNYGLSFGACSTGVMGECYHSFVQGGKSVLSVTVSKYKDDLRNLPQSKHELLDTTFDRTKRLYESSDVIIILSGGTGTLAEIFACLEENRTVDVPKTMILYNQNHYYDSLIDMINKCIEQGLNDPSIYDYIKIVNSIEEIKILVEAYENNHYDNQIKKYSLKK